MLIVCPNLAVDRTVGVQVIGCGEVHRADWVVAQAGGKGANAARVALALGCEPLLVGFAGGAGREVLRAGLAREGIRADLIEIEGETRFTIALVEPSGRATLVNEPGPQVSAPECERLVTRAVENVRPGEPVLVAGSLPPGAPASLYARLGAALSQQPIVVDAAGEALASALKGRPFLVKPNLEEARAFGEAPGEVAAALVAAGARHALVTAGAASAVLATGGRQFRLVPPAVPITNPIGSGDALAAGILVGLERGLSLIDSARLGIATAAENVTHEVAGRVERSRVEQLLTRVEVHAAA
jgi:tagatose 6-phosphate kinase